MGKKEKKKKKDNNGDVSGPVIVATILVVVAVVLGGMFLAFNWEDNTPTAQQEYVATAVAQLHSEETTTDAVDKKGHRDVFCAYDALVNPKYTTPELTAARVRLECK